MVSQDSNKFTRYKYQWCLNKGSPSQLRIFMQRKEKECKNFMSATCWTEVSKYFKDVRNKRERHSDQLGIFKPTNVQQTISFFWNSKYQKDFIHSDPSLTKFWLQGDSYPSRINFGSQGGQLSLVSFFPLSWVYFWFLNCFWQNTHSFWFVLKHFQNWNLNVLFHFIWHLWKFSFTS